MALYPSPEPGGTLSGGTGKALVCAPSLVSQDPPDNDVLLVRPRQTGAPSRAGHPTPGPVLRTVGLLVGVLCRCPARGRGPWKAV